jgi:DNA-directed RNA polymerase subunit F
MRNYNKKYHPKTQYKMLRNNALVMAFAVLASGIFLASCGTGPENQTTQPPVKTELDSAETARLKELEKIFFSIPSPVEMSALIKEKGYVFEAGKLSSTENVDKYTGESRQAINLGIYGADLSYAAMFDQKQITMEYFAAAQKLAKQMGVDGALTSELLERLDRNQESRDSLLKIVSEAYMDLNGYLKESKRIEVSALVVAGGWLEALYLSSVYAMDGNEDLRKRIAEQKYSLNDLVNYFEKFGDKESLREMKEDLLSLKAIYASAQEVKGKTSVSTDDKGNRVIGTTAGITIDDATLKAIATKASELRKKYTSF